MAVVVSMLRGINLAGQHRVKMDALRAMYESLGLRNPRTHLQSGNVVFQADGRNLPELAARIECAFEQTFGFPAAVILRTAAELREVIAANPFAGREDIERGKLLVTFLAGDPGAEAWKKVLALETAPEQLRGGGREIYIYYPNGMGRSKLSWTALAAQLKTPGTGRNWNTVTSLLEIAESLAQ